MILYIHRPEYLEHWVGEGKAKLLESLISKSCIWISETGTRLDEPYSDNCGWHWIFAMDLETGEYIGNEGSGITPAPWVHDPLLRALKVVEFLEQERKKK